MKHLVVISIDALVYDDLEYAKSLPNFKYLIDNGAIIEKVKSVYPTVTHPVHASIMTGSPAGDTKVISNLLFDENKPNRKMRWFNNLNEVGCETIFHVAKRNGLKVCTSTWPLTSYGNDVIDYLVPNAMAEDFDGYNNKLDVFKALGAQDEIIDIIEKALDIYDYTANQAKLDLFQTFCTCEIIKKFKPDIIFTHPSNVDSTRHKTGVFSDKVLEAINGIDNCLGMIIESLKEANIFESTDIVFLSDHGQLNITRTISPNIYLVDNGYITLDMNKETGKVDISSWIAYCKSVGLSSHVYINKNINNKEEIYHNLYNLLKKMADAGIYGFNKVYTLNEVKDEYGLYGDFSFVLETDGYTSFGEYLVRPLVREIDFSDYRYGKATHGYAPYKGPQPTFVGAGPSFRKNVIIKEGSVLNHAPTFAYIMGLEMKEAKGKPVLEILNNINKN